jgi:hypothetical protein
LAGAAKVAQLLQKPTSLLLTCSLGSACPFDPDLLKRKVTGEQCPAFWVKPDILGIRIEHSVKRLVVPNTQ